MDSTSDSPPRRVRSLADIYASSDFARLAIEPTCFEDAAVNEEWMRAMKEELEAIERNKTWRLVDLPDGKDAIGLKWIYKSKFNADGSLKKNKARLVVKGYAQIPGTDFSETFAPVARLDTVRLIISVAAHNGWPLAQLDVKSAFLNGDLIEDVYVNQPEGFVVKGSEHKVYKLHKALYGLRQAPRAWYSKIDSYFAKKIFQKSASEPTLYVKSSGNAFLVVCLYVDVYIQEIHLS